ncbi:MAG TPA: Asp-tRNA(Asn)/Glu-tRNA(Gln) amidotransferase GatCAB subunit C, partial [Clostridiales bacterium]|nr:Asp-tRNA(Asn)/Glu-tRNA(Gln) amidotransferase GatCAB subunit C [Clostridiales bacterium]
MYRTKNLGELRIENVGEEVELSGWIQKIRNLGGMIFIDLRDEDGITQVVVNDEELQLQAKELVKESCIHINGKVVERSSKNPNMPTGDIEVVV